MLFCMKHGVQILPIVNLDKELLRSMYLIVTHTYTTSIECMSPLSCSLNRVKHLGSFSVLNCTDIPNGYQRTAGMGQTLPPLTTTMVPVIPVSSGQNHSPTTVVTQPTTQLQATIINGNWNYATNGMLCYANGVEG